MTFYSDTSAMQICNAGTLAVITEPDGLSYLHDFSLTTEPISDGYDYIGLSSDEKWFLVSTDGETRFGHLSRDGKTARFDFDDCGSFIGGKAIVLEGGDAFVVDDQFNKISNTITSADVGVNFNGVATVGDGVYGLLEKSTGSMVLVLYSEAAGGPSAWARDEVNAAVGAGLVPEALTSGYQENTTRAEFCSLAVTMYEQLKGDIAGRTSFADTDDINVEKLASLGVVNGTNAELKLFEPGRGITREETAVLLSRLANAAGSPLTGHGQGDDFSDRSAFADYAIGAINQVSAADVMPDKGDMFEPKVPCTREESIVAMYRLWRVVG
jgi:hypothetical protein